MGQLIISGMPQGQLGCQPASNGQSCTLSNLESTSAGNTEQPRTTIVATRFTTLVISKSPSTIPSSDAALEPSSACLPPTASFTNSSTQSTALVPSTKSSFLSPSSSFGTTSSTIISATTTSVTSTIRSFVTAAIPGSTSSATNYSNSVPSTTEYAQSTASTISIPSSSSVALSSPSTSLEPTSTLLPLPSQYISPPRYHTPHFVSEQIQAGPVSQHARLVGGVAGAISGLTFILLIILLLWRRRRRKQSSFSPSPSRPAIARPYLPTKNSTRDIYREKGTPKLPEIAVTQTPVIDGNLIRMSLDHWSRPYAHTDPLRSAHTEHTPNRLRITNPDPVRGDGDSPLPTDNPRRFMSRQRSALAVVLATFKRSPSSQTIPQTQAHLSPVPSPTPASRTVSPQPSALESHHPSPLLPSPDPFVQTQRGLPIRLVVSRTPSYDSRPLTVASLRATAGEGEGEDRVMDRFLEGRRDV
ncbi:hypothetical protein MBLNU457_7509t1 [Dothideomycetes sp. NU457]